MFPMRHKNGGEDCEGNIEEAEEVLVYFDPQTSKGKNAIARVERWWLKNRGQLPPENGWREKKTVEGKNVIPA